MKKFNYTLRCFNNSFNLYLFQKIDGVTVCIFHSLGLKPMYDYILENNIDFSDIKISNLTFNDLFEHFIDRCSIDVNYKGDRI